MATTTTTTTIPFASGLVLKSLPYGDGNPVNRPLTLNELEGNFAFLNDHVNSILESSQSIEDRLLARTSDLASLAARITAIENGVVTTTTTTEEQTTTTTTTEEQTTTTTTTEEPTTTTTTTVNPWNIYDFSSKTQYSNGFSQNFGKLGITDWDGTNRIVATDMNYGTQVYYIGTDGDKHLINFSFFIVNDGQTQPNSMPVNYIYVLSGLINEFGNESTTFDSITPFVVGQTSTTTTTTTEEQTTTTTTTLQSFITNAELVEVNNKGYVYNVYFTMSESQLTSRYPTMVQFVVATKDLVTDTLGGSVGLSSNEFALGFRDVGIEPTQTNDFKFVLLGRADYNSAYEFLEEYSVVFNISNATTTTTTTEAPTTTTTTTVTLPNYFNSVTLTDITVGGKGPFISHFYNFLIDFNSSLLQTDYNGQLLGSGGNKQIAMAIIPPTLTTVDWDNDRPLMILPSDMEFTTGGNNLNFVRESYYETYGTYDAVFKMVLFEQIDGIYNFVQFIGQPSQQFNLEPTSLTTTTTTEAPTTTTTTTESLQNYFSSVTLDSINLYNNGAEGVNTVTQEYTYHFTVVPNLELLRSDYSGQLLDNGGNKQIVLVPCPTNKSTVVPDDDDWTEVVPRSLSSIDGSIGYDIYRNQYHNNQGTYDMVFKIAVFELVDGNYNFVQFVGQPSQQFSLEPTSLTTTTTTTVAPTTTTTTTEAPTTTTTTTEVLPNYFSSIGIDNIESSTKDGVNYDHTYHFMFDPNLSLIQSDYNNQLVENGGNKQIVAVPLPPNSTSVDVNNDDWYELSSSAFEFPINWNIRREGYYNTYGTYDLVFKTAIFELVDGNYNFVQFVGQPSQQFSLEPTSM